MRTVWGRAKELQEMVESQRRTIAERREEIEKLGAEIKAAERKARAKAPTTLFILRCRDGEIVSARAHEAEFNEQAGCLRLFLNTEDEREERGAIPYWSFTVPVKKVVFEGYVEWYRVQE